MAYKDSSGNITIDPNEARRDINSIENAISDIDRSTKALRNVLNNANSGKGKTNEAIIVKATILLDRASKSRTKLVETRDYIKNTVEKYKRIDEQIAEQIKSSSSRNGGGGKHA